MDCVIVGGGVAGMQAAFSFRQHWPRKSVLLIDAESEAGYYRTLLPQFMVRTLAENKLFFSKAEKDPKLTVRKGLRVAAVDRPNRQVLLDNGERVIYDRLILASGGRPIIPDNCCSSAKGIFPIRSLAVARKAQKWLSDNPRIVILGGGLVGVKTASHMARPEFSVTLVEKESQLLPLALSSRASALVEAHLRQKQVEVITGSSIDEIFTVNGKLEAIQVRGARIPCQTLLIAIGSLPDLEYLEESGLIVNDGLAVSPTLQTGDPAIFAAGDLVTIDSHSKFTPWTWPQAIIQGKIAGRNVYAKDLLKLNCLTRVNSMNLNGLSLIVLGAPVVGAETIAYSKEGGGIYRELFLKEGKIVGGALVGDISNAGELHAAMNVDKKIDKKDEDLLKPSFRALRWTGVRYLQP